MNILFLSDIHFGRETRAVGHFAQRERILDELIEAVVGLKDSMKPHYIITTGDVAWTGSYGEYADAEVWYRRLLDRTGLSGKHLSFCVGNHDVNRKSAISISESDIFDGQWLSPEKTDTVYDYNNVGPFDVQISEYNEFCYRLGVIPYQYPVDPRDADSIVLADKVRYSYTVGAKTVVYGERTYRIVSFNTAMLSGYASVDDDEMFIGLPQIEKLTEMGILAPERDENTYRIALMHHAERFLNTNEINSYGERAATLPLLLSRVDLLLCGHTETGAVPTRRYQGDGGLLYNGGAAYYSDDHPNSFSVLHIDEETGDFDSCSFIWKNGRWTEYPPTSQMEWSEKQEEAVPNGFLIDRASPWEIRLSVGDAEKRIKAPYMDFGLYAVGDRMEINYNNYRDINRLLDIYGTSGGLRIGRSQTYKNSVRAMLAHIDYNEFMFTATQNGELPCKVEYIAPDGSISSEGMFMLCTTEQGDNDRRIIPILEEMSRLEDIFKVRFTVSDTEVIDVQKQAVITFLSNLAADGGGALNCVSGSRFAYFCDRKDVFSRIADELVRDQNRFVTLTYDVPLVCSIFGAEIELGMCEVNIVNLRLHDLSILQKQLESYLDGDTRRIVLDGVGTTALVIIPHDKFDFPDAADVRARIATDTLKLQIESQALLLGREGLLKPNEKLAKRLGLQLSDTLKGIAFEY